MRASGGGAGEEVTFLLGFGVLHGGGRRSNSWEMRRAGSQTQANEELVLAGAECVEVSGGR